MKKLYIVFFTSYLILFSCTHKEREKEFYSGYIYYGDFPMNAVLIKEQGNTNNCTHTNTKGFFSLRRKNLNNVSNLILTDGKGNTDTIQLLRGGFEFQSISYLFCRNQIDTFDLKWHRDHTKTQ